MPKYANYDHTAAAPQPVLGYYDTDFTTYPNLPPAADLFEMTDEQWNARSLSPSVIDNGEIVVLPPPPLTPQQEADAELARRRANGIAITSKSDQTDNATYPLDDAALITIGPVARDVSSGLGLPNNANTWAFADLAGVSHDLKSNQVTGLYIDMRDMVSLLQAQAQIMAGGGTPVWPDQIGEIP